MVDGVEMEETLPGGRGASPDTIDALLQEHIVEFGKFIDTHPGKVAMVEALKSGKIFSLGLDVYNGEPNIHPEYLTLSNVYVLPHLGSSTKETRTAMADLAFNNIDEFFKTGKCKNTVN